MARTAALCAGPAALLAWSWLRLGQPHAGASTALWLIALGGVPALLSRPRHRLVVLVGDMPYYARCGFIRIPKGEVTMPGPVDPARLLVAELTEGAFAGVSGAIRPDWDQESEIRSEKSEEGTGRLP